AIVSGFEVVVGPDRNIQFLFVIPIHVPEPHVERTVGIRIVTFVYRSHSLPRPMPNLHELRARGLRKQQDSENESENRPRHIRNSTPSGISNQGLSAYSV